MNEIILTDDDLKRLEKRFGPAVRHMGSWNSDGTFSYLAVPITTVQKVLSSEVSCSFCAPRFQTWQPETSVLFPGLL